MKAILRQLLLVACALHLSGAHWALLQVGAWTGMLVTRVGTQGVSEAVKTTFDGEHPCAMCVAIKSGQKEEKRTDADAPVLKELGQLKIAPIVRCVLPSPARAGAMLWSSALGEMSARADAPPTPPPLA